MSTPNPTLQPHRITTLPPNFYYLPNFLTPSEEASLLAKIPPQRWTHLTHRRLQAHPSTLTTTTNTLLAAPLPPWLTDPITTRFKHYSVFADTPHAAPNHVLINEYRAGEGIMLHEDGAAYAPVVATVSLGGSVCLDVVAKSGSSLSMPGVQLQQPTRIFQERRSLLITTGAAYTECLHGIAPVAVDEALGPDTVANWALLGDAAGVVEAGGRNVRGVRTSLTYRDVLRVSLAASRVFGGGMGRR